MLDGRGNIMPVFVGEAHRSRLCSANTAAVLKRAVGNTGENESSALLSELQRLPSVSVSTVDTDTVDLYLQAPQSALMVLQGRPITHDLMKNSLEALGYRVGHKWPLTVFKMLNILINCLYTYR